MAGKNLDTGNLDGARQIQQLPHKAPILQLNDETTGNTENIADHSSLFEIFVHHYLISSACLCFMARTKITFKTLFCCGLHFQYFWKLLSLVVQIDCAVNR